MATGLMMHLGSLDNVHTSTVRAFAASEMETMMDKLPKSEVCGSSSPQCFGKPICFLRLCPDLISGPGLCFCLWSMAG